MIQVHEAFPQKNLYFTEQSVTEHGDTANLNIARIIIAYYS